MCQETIMNKAFYIVHGYLHARIHTFKALYACMHAKLKHDRKNTMSKKVVYFLSTLPSRIVGFKIIIIAGDIDGIKDRSYYRVDIRV